MKNKNKYHRAHKCITHKHIMKTYNKQNMKLHLTELFPYKDIQKRNVTFVFAFI